MASISGLFSGFKRAPEPEVSASTAVSEPRTPAVSEPAPPALPQTPPPAGYPNLPAINTSVPGSSSGASAGASAAAAAAAAGSGVAIGGAVAKGPDANGERAKFWAQFKESWQDVGGAAAAPSRCRSCPVLQRTHPRAGTARLPSRPSKSTR
jgi:hypothetical protein